MAPYAYAGHYSLASGSKFDRGTDRVGRRQAPDAVLDRQNIAIRHDENIGVQSHFEALAAMIEGDTTTVKIQVTGNGYNGGGAFVIASERRAHHALGHLGLRARGALYFLKYE